MECGMLSKTQLVTYVYGSAVYSRSSLNIAWFPVSPLQFLRRLLSFSYCKRRKNWSGETGNEATLNMHMNAFRHSTG